MNEELTFFVNEKSITLSFQTESDHDCMTKTGCDKLITDQIAKQLKNGRQSGSVYVHEKATYRFPGVVTGRILFVGTAHWRLNRSLVVAPIVPALKELSISQ